MRIGRVAASVDALRRTGRQRAALATAALALLIAGTGCEPTWVEVANETPGLLTVTVFIDGARYSPFVHEVEPGGVVALGVGTDKQRWEISDQDGIVLVEAIVSSGNADFYDGRIVVR